MVVSGGIRRSTNSLRSRPIVPTGKNRGEQGERYGMLHLLAIVRISASRVPIGGVSDRGRDDGIAGRASSVGAGGKRIARMIVGVPKEIKTGKTRVSTTPAGAAEYVAVATT